MSFWMCTATGKKVTPTAFTIDDVDPFDIGHALANQCRFNGHTEVFYSVAEHCVHVANFIHDTTKDDKLALAGLLHDGAEAYTGDLIWPLKQDPALGAAFRAIEKPIEAVIAKYFCVEYDWPAIVHEVDKRILNDERMGLMKEQIEDWHSSSVQPLGIMLPCWSPWRARREWLIALRDFGGPHVPLP